MLYQAVVLKLLYDVIKFSGPALLNAVITYLSDIAAGAEGASEAVGYGYVSLLAASAVLQTVILHQYFLRMFRLGMHLRTAVIGSVFRKALRLSVAARQQRTVGQIINVASTDASRMRDLATYLVMLESGPVQITLSVVFLWQQIGPSVLVGVAAMVLFIPINLTIARLQKQLQGKLMKIKDKRIDSTFEAVSAAKLIKLHAWEDEIVGRITDTRNSEITQLWWYMLVRNASTVLWVGLPLIVSVLSFATFVWTGGQLTAAKAFTALSLFSILQFPLAMFPSVINNCIEALVSIQRIESFLGSGEVEASSCLRVDPLGLGTNTGDADPALASPAARLGSARPGSPRRAGGSLPAIELSRASFSWAPPSLTVSPAKAAAAAAAGGGGGGRGGSSDRYQVLASSDGDSEQAPDTTSTLSRAVMSDVSFSVAQGELVVVAGRVGSGKTSLLHGILGELHKLSGSAVIRGSVAFVSQAPFILNDTLKNNILFGRELDQARYEEVLRVCHLTADLKELPGGDQCEIGERGINLSGGTRARVSLARGVYADCDVYLLDDPLSAVDAHVGAGIFGDCITGALADKTRLLVTHGVSFMRSCSRVLVVKDGAVVQQGPLEELLRGGVEASEIRDIVSSYEHDTASMASAGATAAAASTAGDDESDDVAASASASTDTGAGGDSGSGGEADADDKEAGAAAAAASTVGAKTAESRSVAGRLTKREELGRGTVRLGVFSEYAKALGGTPVVAGMALLFILAQGSQVLVNWWLSHWSNGVQGVSEDRITALNQEYLAGYAALSVLSLFVVAALRVSIAIFGVRAAKRLHAGLINAVPWARMAFFDTTPVGRIINRFSGDMYTVDESLMPTIASLGSTICTVIGTVIVISSATPLFLLLLLPLLFIYLYTQRYYVSTSRELQRLDSASRSPIVAQFGEALGGAVTIRAYADQPRFRRLSDALVDTNQSAYFAGVSANRWLAVRLEFVGALVTTGAALFAVVARDSIDPSVAGLSISYALSITQTLNWTVRMMSNVETQIVSVERIREYSSVQTEPRALKPGRASPPPPAQAAGEHACLTQAQADAVAEAHDARLVGWPSRGEIRIRNLRLQYRTETPAVLHGVDMDVPAASKVGIVGRTGAGKSSLVSALFRLAEVQTGLVSIDGVDIATIPLRILRSRIAIIPQEATLLTGTVRTNLDPFKTFSSEQLRVALSQVGVMRHLVKRLAEKDEAAAEEDAATEDEEPADSGTTFSAEDELAVLDLDVSEGGGNFSAGTRQLLCVARAVLKQCRVVVLDEASSSMDAATDAALQKAIRTEFADATVLTIAHRLHTILDSSMVVVMGSGRVLESAAPATLLADPESEFSQLVKWSRGKSSDSAST
jgi:ABC-type multidrug transport system fused ATPase/permease subunit